jgi:hypothetical protein
MKYQYNKSVKKLLFLNLQTFWLHLEDKEIFINLFQGHVVCIKKTD